MNPRIGRRATRLVVAAVAALVMTACGADGIPQGSSTHQQGSGIKVDGPGLRALKASTDIAPCPQVASTSAAVDGGLPRLTLPCLGGGRDVDLAGLRGPLVLNFWAQYCGPCRQESPLLQKLSTASHGRVQVIGVDFIDSQPDAALAFAKELGLTYPQVADPQAAAKAPLRIAGLPWTFFIAASGRIVYTQTGPVTSGAQLATLLHDHLGVDVPELAGS